MVGWVIATQSKLNVTNRITVKMLHIYIVDRERERRRGRGRKRVRRDGGRHGEKGCVWSSKGHILLGGIKFFLKRRR